MRVLVDFFKKFFPYIRGHYASFGIAIAGSLLAALSQAGIAYMIEPLLGTLQGKVPRDTPLFNISFEEMARNNTLAFIVPALIVFVYFCKSLGMYIQSYFMSYIGQDIVRQVRDKMLQHLLSFDLGFFNKMRGGELMSRISNDIGIIRMAVSNYVIDIIREITTIAGFLVIVFYQSPKLAIIGLVIIPLAIIPISLIVKKLKKYARTLQEKNADITAKLSEIFNNIEIIKASNGEKLESQTFERQNKEFLRVSMKSTKVGELTSPLMEVLGAVALGAIIYVATLEIQAGNITTESFASFCAALFMIYTPLKRLINLWGYMQGAIVASDRIFEILDKKPHITDGSLELKGPIDSIEVRGVEFSYGESGEEAHALKGVSLEFKRNQITALVGKSGSGKSTLINLILRLYEVQKGEILINGKNIKHFTQKSLRENIAIVTQRIFIFNDTIAHNVAYGLQIDEAKVLDSLKKAQMSEYIASLPNGIHTILDEFGTNLSGGQRQRIAIARALYKNPDILILDEVTSALDSQTEDLIKEAINAVRADKIIILIAHRPSTIELANNVVEMRDGKIFKQS